MMSRIRCVFDERQLAHAPLREMHNGNWTAYQEMPARAEMVLEALGSVEAARDWGREPLLTVHDKDYLDLLEQGFDAWRAAGREGDAIPYVWPVVGRRTLPLARIAAKLGRHSYDAGTPIAEHSWSSAYWSAQSALTALDIAANTSDRKAFALCRPPGHHAGADYFGGYCYLNNAAIAASEARRRGLGPVAILDIDYHHGNGTQDIFYADRSIFFVSIHADPATDYPFFWGYADETGTEAGSGSTLNLPLARGADMSVYQPALDRALAAIKAWGAQFLTVSFGADTFAGDPISHFRLMTDDYRLIGRSIAASRLPTLAVMEGGYAVSDLGGNVAAFLEGLSKPP